MRYQDIQTPGSHDPKEHMGPVDPSGKEIKELRPKDKDIPLSKAKMMLTRFYCLEFSQLKILI